jgi:hypothetical protein
VDATFSVWRHHKSLAGAASRKIAACALVHGFDIALDDVEKFDTSLALAEETLGSIGLELVPLRTNLRVGSPRDWNDIHGAATVAALHFLKHLAPVALVGSTEAYDQLVLPYGSNPITDPLLSSASLEVVHDGAGFDRTQKVRAISSWEVAFRNLRVCWKGKQAGANCGHCEKCLRTRLNFMANGIAPPESLESGSAPDFRLLDSEHPLILREFGQILLAAHRRGVKDPWVRALAHRLTWLGRRNAFRRTWRSLKRALRPLVRRSP